MEVKPGPLSAVEAVVEQIYTVLPERWKLVRKTRSENEFGQTAEEETLCVFLTGKQGRKATDDEWIAVTIYIPLSSAARPSGSRTQIDPEMDLWGDCPWGPVYAKSYNAQSLWPTYKDDLIKALAIRPPD